MTAENDNIRHYIGDLEATEDIDVLFKHIYDLMLANGGEGSGLNADMVDGYHASDFAPASIIDEIEQCIHTIYLEDGGDPYTGKEVILEILARHIYYASSRYPDAYDLESFLNQLIIDLGTIEEDIEDIKEITDALSQEGLIDKLTKFINENFICKDGECFVNADSVNGLSFVLVTQEQYDTEYTAEQKKDPTNIFIINDDIDGFDTTEYAPPSILRAGMKLKYRINEETKNIEFSIDNGQSWKVALPLVSSNEDNAEVKGILHPHRFKDIKDYITNNSGTDSALLNQSNYPFMLYNSATSNAINQIADNISQAGNYWMSGIRLDNDNNKIYKLSTQTDTVNAKKGILDINLNSYLTNWISNNANNVKTALDINNLSNYELKSNKITTNSVSDADKTSTTKYISANTFCKTIDSLRNNITQNTTNITNLTNKIAITNSNDFLQSLGNNVTWESIYKDVQFKVFDCTHDSLRFRKNGEPYPYFTSGFYAYLQVDDIGHIDITKRGGVAQLSLYYKHATLYKKKNMYLTSESTGKFGEVECTYSIPIFRFPDSFYPAMSGYYPNTLQKDMNNDNNTFTYFKYFRIDTLQDGSKWLCMLVTYPDEITPETASVVANITYVLDASSDAANDNNYKNNVANTNMPSLNGKTVHVFDLTKTYGLRDKDADGKWLQDKPRGEI